MADLTNTMICWNPGGDVALVSWPARGEEDSKFSMSSGACYFSVQKSNFEARKCRVFIDALTLIVRDGCDPQKVHAALLGLDEYVDGLPDDMLPKSLLRKCIEKEDA